MAERDDPGKTQPEEVTTGGAASRPGGDVPDSTETGSDPFETRVTEGSIEAFPCARTPTPRGSTRTGRAQFCRTRGGGCGRSRATRRARRG